MADTPLSLSRILRLLAAGVVALGLLILLPRLAVETQWFAQFGAQAVLWRRWMFQLLAFAVVMGLGVPLQLQQLNRCWRLRQEAPRKQLPSAPLVALSPRPLLAVLMALLLLLAGGLTYLLVQAKDLIAAPFSGRVITGIPVLADLPPWLFVGLAAGLLLPLLL